jgi:hypothetical protein
MKMEDRWSNISKMFDYTHFEAYGHFYLLTMISEIMEVEDKISSVISFGNFFKRLRDRK